MTYPVHLGKEDIINLGSYYTNNDFVNIVWDFITPFIKNNSVIFDPACGYGNFLSKNVAVKKIGNDIDKIAINFVKKNIKNIILYNFNALKSPSREKFGIKDSEHLIIIGNPPYNDYTSHAKKNMKKILFDIDEDLKTRDIGISFLRMFEKLNSDIVAVLHPLSYLIKKTNFNLLKNFKDNYRLVKGIVISSKVFNFTSKNSEFPILISLYEKNKNGMTFEYVSKFRFETIDKKTFSLNDFDYIGNYIDKYPKKNVSFQKDDILFYTLRDINALKRNKTFIQKPTTNAIKVPKEKINYFIYVDVFKDFIDYIPFYLRNFDIIFNKELFEKYKDYFISYSLKKNKILKEKMFQNFPIKTFNNEEKFIKMYLKKTLKGHFNENL